MRAVDLSFALLIDADLSFSTLREADLTSAIATRVDLRDTDLVLVDLGGTNLTDADLRSADLGGATVTNTVWTGALYDEDTVFPFSKRIDDGAPWGHDGGISPWNAGMIPAPEPAASTMMLVGLGGASRDLQECGDAGAQVGGLS